VKKILEMQNFLATRFVRLVLAGIREIGSRIPLNIYFEILLSVRKKKSTQAKPALKKGLRRLSVRLKIAYAD
jgi:hypothetical protein